MIRSVPLLFAVSLSIVLGGAMLPAQTEATSAPKAKAEAGPKLSDVAARVNEATISVGEVGRELGLALGELKPNRAEFNRLQAQTLGLLVNRELVLQSLQRQKLGASEKEIDLAVENLKNELKEKGKTLEGQLKEMQMTETEIKRAFAWQIGWPNYLATRLLPEHLETHFRENKRDFDGTKLRVAHLLRKIDNFGDKAAVDLATEDCRKLREAITAGSISFANAAKKYSFAPTASEGGDIGLIERNRPMPPSFNNAAFLLKKGETSPPTVTSAGVHLIHCLEIEPGKKDLTDPDVEQEVREDLIRHIFMTIVEKERPTAKISFTGVTAHFKPGTSEVIAPPAPPEAPETKGPVVPIPMADQPDAKSEKKP